MTDDFLARFGGIARLYGVTALENFSKSHVMVIGLGGVGSWAVEALARSGIGHLSLVDMDDLCQTNINRQIHALTTTVGKSKSAVLAARCREINPEIRITEHQSFYSERTSEEILFNEKPGVLIDAIDSKLQKCHLLATCRQHEVPVITSGSVGGRTDATQVLIDDLSKTFRDPLLLSVRRSLRTHYGFPKTQNVTTKHKAPKFQIDAIFSSEQPFYSQCDGSTSIHRPKELQGSIKCDSGFGAATHLTATFGNLAAGWVLNHISKSKKL